MHFERVTTMEEFRNLKPAWEVVYDGDPEAHFFLSWQWLAGVLAHHPDEWVVLVARDGNGICHGVLPLRMKTVWSDTHKALRNELQFAGRLFWADYGGLLCLPDHEEEVLAGFADFLKQMNWSHFYMKGLRISDRRFGAFIGPLVDDQLIIEARSSRINDEETDNLVCPFVDLPQSFEGYLAESLGSSTRQKARRLLRKIESGSEYRLTATTPTTQSQDLQILETLWSGMWNQQKGADTAQLAAKYRVIVQRGLEDNLVHQSLLWHADKPVGLLAAFVDRVKSRLLFFVGCRDESFQELPVGLVLHICNIRWAIENGLRTYDFLRGNESYKYSLGASDARLRYVLVRTRTGNNLNRQLDKACLKQALFFAADYAARNRTEKAHIARQQILEAFPDYQQSSH